MRGDTSDGHGSRPGHGIVSTRIRQCHPHLFLFNPTPYLWAFARRLLDNGPDCRDRLGALGRTRGRRWRHREARPNCLAMTSDAGYETRAAYRVSCMIRAVELANSKLPWTPLIEYIYRSTYSYLVPRGLVRHALAYRNGAPTQGSLDSLVSCTVSRYRPPAHYQHSPLHSVHPPLWTLLIPMAMRPDRLTQSLSTL